jgi:hypothetical protein
VLLKKVRPQPLPHYLFIGIMWTAIAVTGDYLFIIQLLKPADGYYKLDVYLYYLFTLILPILVGWYQQKLNKISK